MKAADSAVEGPGYKADMKAGTWAERRSRMDLTVDFTDSLGLRDLSERIGSVFSETDLSFFDLIVNAMKGENGLSLKCIWNSVREAFSTEAADYKTIFASILILGIFSAVFAQFGQLFESRQIADISYDIVFLLMAMLLLKIMQKGIDITQESLQTIADFSKLLVPTYCLSVGFAAGHATAVAFYELALIVIYIVENLLLVAVVPLIYVYTLLSVMGGISSDNRMDGILMLTKKGIGFALKCCVTVISGIGLLQGMITPVLDSVNTGALKKLASVIPGIGGFVDTASDVVYGSAILVKNAVGVAGILLLLFLCAMPLFKLFLLALSLKAAAAVSGVAADARMSRCVDQVSEGSVMLLKTMTCAMALFIVTIAVIAVTTNRGF